MKQGPLNGLFYVPRQAMPLNSLRIGELLKDGEFSPHLKTLWVWLYPIKHYIQLDEPGYFTVNNRIPVMDQYRFGCYTRFEVLYGVFGDKPSKSCVPEYSGILINSYICHLNK